MYEPPDRRRIFLLRHAEAAYLNEQGEFTDDPRMVPLTPAGRIQARKQAAVLASVEFDRAICSGLPRTQETARHILSSRPLPELEIESRLEEIQGGGGIESTVDPASWLAHVANTWAGADEPDARFLGGEKFGDFASRVIPAFEEILADKSWRTLLLVLHGAVNRMLINHVLGLGWQGSASIEQDNCCINVIDVDAPRGHHPRRFLIRSLNLTGYDLNKSSFNLTTMEQTALRMAADFDSQDP
jgi:probable phosphoglycerate mutase